MDAPLHRLEWVNHDIAAMKVDAIVNAANTELRGGGAIRRGAGTRLAEDGRRLGGCPAGEAA